MGKLIVIDGADGSGKATQVKLLAETLRARGLMVETIDFPQYVNNHFGRLLRECLDGKRGDFLKIDPKIASVIYAADRFESSKQIKTWLDEDKIVIADRYVSANMLHQGAKIVLDEDRREFLTWLDKMEHGVFDIPRPDTILYLNVPYSVRLHLMGKDKSRAELDIAEVDVEHQQNTESAAQKIVSELNSWIEISCVTGNEMRSREAIQADIISHVEAIL